MATWDDVERLAGALPEVAEGTSWGRRAWKVAGSTFLAERPLGTKDRAALGDAAPDGPVISVGVSGEGEKAELLATEPDSCFTIPHFDGYPAVLVRLDDVEVDLLRELVTDSWRCAAPAKVRRAHDTV